MRVRVPILSTVQGPRQSSRHRAPCLHGRYAVRCVFSRFGGRHTDQRCASVPDACYLAVAVWLLLTAAAMAQPAGSWQGKTARQWADQLTNPDIRARWYACYVLGQLGPQASEAVEPLQKVLQQRSEQEYVRGNAAWALGRIAPGAEAAIPLLMETIYSKGHISVRRNSVEALGNLGVAAKRAVPDLLKLLGDEDLVTRVNAAVALWKIDHHPQAVPALVEMLRHGTPPAPYEAAVALGRLGAKPEVVAPALIEAFHQPDADVRRAAARSLGQLGRTALRALRDKKALDDPDEDARSTVVEAMGWMGPDGVKPLVNALGDKSPAVRRAAARALGQLGAAARSAEPSLVEVVNDPNELVRKAAATALQLIRVE